MIKTKKNCRDENWKNDAYKILDLQPPNIDGK